MGFLKALPLSSMSETTWATLCIALLAAHLCHLIIRRLYLSPIAHIPGPRLAALTWAYEFYYDVILGGQYTFKILDLHKQHGPVIRINPVEVHVLANNDFYHELYAGAHRRREKWHFYARQFGANESVFSTVDHDLHKMRRAALNPFFSVANVKRLQSVIEEQVENVLRRLSDHARSTSKTPPEPLDLVFVFAAFTNDVINEYAFARSGHLVNMPDFGRATIESIQKGTHMGTVVKHIPWALQLITALPDVLTERYVPGWNEFNRLRMTIRAQITEIKQLLQSGNWRSEVGHRTIFHELMASSSLPPEEKTVERLAHDGQVLNQAGTLTTSYALCVAVYHLLDQPDCLRKLRDELLVAFPKPNALTMSIADLQQLPYLSAVTKEAMRLGFAGTGTRLSRVAPDETLEYVEKTAHGDKIWMIPPGTPVGMTPYQILTDVTLYPDPFAFRPQRWLEGGAEPQELYSVVFNAGTRSCLGQNLARAELHLMLAKLFLRWGGGGHVGGDDGIEIDRGGDAGFMRLFETAVRDTQMAADRFVPEPHKGSKGVRIVLKSFENEVH